MLKLVKGFEAKDGKGRKIVVTHSFNQWNEDCGYGVWVQCENYQAGKIVKTWRYVMNNQSLKNAITKFQKLAK